MSTKKKDTKKLLIIHAGKLFADYGFDGVTTRMIAESAGKPLSAIHYHFTNKEDLYVAAFEYVHVKDSDTTLMEVLEEAGEKGKTPQGQAEIIYQAVQRYFHTILRADRPTWERKLLFREVLNPSSALPAMAKSFIQSHVRQSEEFCKLIQPDMDERDRVIWADTLFSHLFLYILAQRQIEAVRGKKWLNQDFYERVTRMIARFMILELDLPLPESLRKTHHTT